MRKFSYLLSLGACAISAFAQSAQSTNQVIYTYSEAMSGLGLYGLNKPIELLDGSGNLSKDASAALPNASNFSNLHVSGFERPFNLGIAVQLSTLPIASPASGVIFQEDKNTGAMLPASDSLGPILTERAETIGKGRFYSGYTRQQFRFNRIEGQRLGDITNLYVGGDTTDLTQAGQAQTTSPVVYGTQVDLRLDQNVAFFTYGLTSRIDVSTALTWVHSSMSVIGFNAREVNSGNPGNGGTCWCAATLDVHASQNDPSGLGLAGFQRSGIFGSAYSSSSGIGDTLVRVKAAVIERQYYALAIGSDLRFPTGDAKNYHGSGAFGFKPFVAYSLHSARIGRVLISPDVNIGYQVNGSSVLAGDAITNQKQRLPDQFLWSVGAAVAVTRRLTFVADVLGDRIINSYRLVETSVPGRGASAGVASGLTLAPHKQSFNMNSGSFGFKTKSVGNLVFTANLLVGLDDNGLRDKYVPLFGVGYSF